MPFTDYTTEILGLEDANIVKVEEDEKHHHIYLIMQRRAHTCPMCGLKTISVHDYRWQTVKDLPAYGKATVLHIRKRRYLCEHCGKKFIEKIPFLPRYHRVTNRLVAHVISSFAELNSMKEIAKEHSISPTTAARYFGSVEYKCKSLPEALSIDEFKGNAGGQKYQCIIADAGKHKVLDILPNRKQEDLLEYFRTFSTRKSVKYFVMDMNRSYLEIASICFPKATVVIDKYHVVRQVLWDFEKVRKAEQYKFSADRRKYFKRSRRLLLKSPAKLTTEEVDQLSEMLKISPRLGEAYNLKNRFLEFMRSKDRAQAKERLARWLLLAEFSNLPEFKTSLTAIHNWDQYILNAFDCGYTNGFTEGCNNKIKVLKRISFGVRNFARFRKRILHIMNSKVA
jgi:transposase